SRRRYGYNRRDRGLDLRRMFRSRRLACREDRGTEGSGYPAGASARCPLDRSALCANAGDWDVSRLIHAGSVVVDHVYRIDRLPEPGGEKTASSYDRLAGGGFNLMVAARRCGMEVLFAGKLGTGPNGDFLRSQLERQ